LEASQRLETWVEGQLSRGKYGFGLELLRAAFSEQTDTAVKFALKRLSDKGKIVSIYKGYYLIIPPQYAGKGILPPAIFLDAFMKHLQRDYYAALLSAAAFHGAAHQQPQEFFVVTGFPTLRPTLRKGIKVNYISIRQIPEALLEKRKTETGYLTISNPVLTATDLIQFEKRIGGLNRAVNVLVELMEAIQPEDFNEDLFEHTPATVLQRLGYLLEHACSNRALANHLYDALKTRNKTLFRVALKSTLHSKGFSSDNRWNVIVNAEIEVEE
jgi:predicted transcriptional regulator of viral defense system